MTKRIEHHEYVWRSRKEEVDDLVIVLERVSGQSWEEVLEAVREKVRLVTVHLKANGAKGGSLPSSAGDAMVCDRENPGLRIEESQLDAAKLRHSARLINVGFSGVESQSAVRDVPLLWAQCLPSVWEVWQDDHDDETDEDCQCALNDV